MVPFFDYASLMLLFVKETLKGRDLAGKQDSKKGASLKTM